MSSSTLRFESSRLPRPSSALVRLLVPSTVLVMAALLPLAASAETGERPAERGRDGELPSFVLRAARSLTVEEGATVMGGAIGGSQVTVSGARVESIHAPVVRVVSAVVSEGVFADELVSSRSEYGFWSSLDPDGLTPIHGRPRVAPGDGELVVRSGERVWLERSVGAVHVHANGSLLIAGGFFELESLTVDQGALVLVRRPTRLAVRNRFSLGAGAYAGPEPQSATALNLQIDVEGSDTRRNLAVEIGEDATIHAEVRAPMGTILMRRRSSAYGRFEAMDIRASASADIRGFGLYRPATPPCSILVCGGEATAGGTIDLFCHFEDYVPDIANWLASHSNVRDAIQWQHTVSGNPYEPQPQDMVAYTSWTVAEQAELTQSFGRYWHAYCEQDPLAGDAGLVDPPVNVTSNIANDTNSAQTKITDQAMRDLLIANIGHSLVLELGDLVPWSLAGDDSQSLEIYFASLGHGKRVGNQFTTGASGPLGYLKDWHTSHGNATPAPPAWTFHFLASNGLIGPTRYDTIVNLLNWSRNNMVHFFGQASFQQTEDTWQYRGHPPVSRVASGTLDPIHGFEHWTAGCHGTAGFFRAVLRAANIPVQVPLACGHAQIHFRSEGLYLDHGDDPYSYYASALFPPEAALIDQPTYVDWFGANLDHLTTGCANIGRRPQELQAAASP